MGIQYMTPGTGLPLIIETPMGLIDIRWDPAGRRKRLIVKLPDGVCVHRGEARAMKNLKFLKQGENGTLLPAYSLLAPVVGEDGGIRGVRKPERLSLKAT